ncbi:MAG: hypothetical protein ACLP4V_13890 [Methylocella sp.]
MCDIGARAENICSLRAFLILTQSGHAAARGQPIMHTIFSTQSISGSLAVWFIGVLDTEGEVFDVLFQIKRNNHAALKLMRKLSLTPHKRQMSAMPPKDRLSQLVRKSRMRDNKRAMNEFRVNQLS